MDKISEKFGTVKIKKEKTDDDDGNINEFAESAMNELLGLYGYGTNRDEATGKLPGSSSSNSHRESNSPDISESPKYTEGCEWCGKSVDETKGLSSSASGAIFCSEMCFSQSRRANFKKNKTCDWCRHVRHTISYVDFQDGASQLQFCSTKCLNQYKMHIFCRETRAHLELHPHVPDDSMMSTGNLITPDLWLQNCKSPEPCESLSSNPNSPKTIESQPQTSPLPLITLTHPSKLMDSSRLRSRLQKKPRKRCRSTVTASLASPVADIPQDLRIRHTPPELNQCSDEPRFLKRDFMEQFCGSYYNGYPRTPHSKLMYCPSAPQPPIGPTFPSPAASLLPPVTVLVPYPIIIPLPLPIPIPIPLSKDDFEKLSKKSVSNEKQSEFNQTTQNCGVGKYNEETILDKNVTSVVTEKPLRKRKRTVLDSKNKSDPAAHKNKKFVPV